MTGRIRRGRAAAKRVVNGGERPGFDAAESPLGWLRQRKDKDGAPLISEIQFDAGERLRADFTFAHMSPRVTVNWSGAFSGSSGARGAPGAGADIQDHVIAAAERVRRALGAVGPELNGILIDVCCHLKGLEHVERIARMPPRSARVVLLIALGSLARHYGMDRSVGSRDARPNIRHWGAEGFKPRLEELTAGSVSDTPGQTPLDV